MEEPRTQPFPATISAKVETLDEEEDCDVIWSELELKKLGRPFSLPSVGDGSFQSIKKFVETEIKLQVEIMRDDIHKKVSRVGNLPKEATDQHLRFRLPSRISREISLPMTTIHKEPSRVFFTNSVLVFQIKAPGNNNSMKDMCLAFCKYMRKNDGALFVLGKDRVDLSHLPAGSMIYARPLRNFNMLKTHIRAIAVLKKSEAKLNESFVTRKLLQARRSAQDIRSQSDLDSWIHSKRPENEFVLDLSKFNEQQQRALVLEKLTSKGVVFIQGPPGTQHLLILRIEVFSDSRLTLATMAFLSL